MNCEIDIPDLISLHLPSPSQIPTCVLITGFLIDPILFWYSTWDFAGRTCGQYWGGLEAVGLVGWLVGWASLLPPPANSHLLHGQLALGDWFWLFIQTLNSARKSFNSIFNSKTKSNYSFKEFIHSKTKSNYLFKEFIHSKTKANHSFKELFIQNGQNNPAWENS